MPDRDLDITKFSYKAYRKLKKTLGEFDAVVECNEIAIREFIEKIQSEDQQKYIQQLSTKHKVGVGAVNFVQFSSRIRHYYVASVFQQSEQFLKDFKEECRRYLNSNKWIEKTNDETKLQNISRNLSIELDSDLIDIYEYYRMVRNYMAHTDRDIKKLKSCHKKVEKNKNDFLKEMHLSNMPNSLENINFNDFLILTNIVKHIAFKLSNQAKPKNKRIAEILFELSITNEKRAYKGLKKLKTNNIRYEKALKSFAITSFGRFSTKDIDEVTREFKCLLA
jgi:hypothetical protein